MALDRRGNRFSTNIWPGFVDAMTALLMVLMFVLTIFMVVQSVLRDRITTQDDELTRLGREIAGLSETLGTAQDRAAGLETDLAAARDAGAALQARLDSTTLDLEAQRKAAEETLTLLAAAEAARDQARTEAAAQLTEAQRQAALLALAQERLNQQDSQSAEDARRTAALNAQLADLRANLGRLNAVLAVSDQAQTEAQAEITDLGTRLNAALLRAAEAEKARSDLEHEARTRAETEAQDLARYRSEFFGRLSEILAGRQGVQVVGDRFVFDSEVLFASGEATLSDAGRAQIRQVADMLRGIAGDIPEGIDWIIRVDGHTDNVPLSGSGRFRDNWELSQARALAVVRYMVNDLGFPAARLAATGFGETRPITQGDSPEARAQNRRIELKLTER